ncbi:MAG: SpoIID/LytB domain-containing protein [Selenomonadales bacterium]|nr:SpoIID/LytB domain-containing protein [Selenomonadales bacterium]
MKRILLCLGLIGMLLLAGCGGEEAQEPHGEPEIRVYFHEENTVRQMPLESYLEGVVAGEMKNDWPIEALKAQAIVARTYTLAKMAEGELTEHSADASTDIREFQAYRADAVNDAVKQAVQMTRGQVLEYEGAPILAWFHASAGGKTATAAEGLGYTLTPTPYIQPVMSPDEDAPEDVQRWEVTFTQDEMTSALASLGHNVEKVSSVMITAFGPSGRTVNLLINGSINLSGPQLRLALGSTELKSMMLEDISVSERSITFRGRGYGHGVGMSQWGAHHMANAGFAAENIVLHYYPGAVLNKRWE